MQNIRAGRTITPRIISPSKNQRTRVRISSPSFVRNKGFLKGNLIHTNYVLNTQRAGFRQVSIGQSTAEQRAVPVSMVKGTIYERILYKALMDSFHLIPGVDFDLHSMPGVSTGSRIPGVVISAMKIAIAILGKDSDTYSALSKDSELRMVVESHGFEFFEITEDTIMDDFDLDYWLQKIMGWNHGGGVDASHDTGDTISVEATSYPQIEAGINSLKDVLNG